MLSLANASSTLEAPIKFDNPAENVAVNIPDNKKKDGLHTCT